MSTENNALRDELQRLSEECEKLTSENNSIKVSLSLPPPHFLIFLTIIWLKNFLRPKKGKKPCRSSKYGHIRNLMKLKQVSLAIHGSTGCNSFVNIDIKEMIFVVVLWCDSDELNGLLSSLMLSFVSVKVIGLLITAIILLLKQEELTRVCGADAVAANLKQKNPPQLQSHGVEGKS